MKAYEIDGWLDGVKIRLPSWGSDYYMYFNRVLSEWLDSNGHGAVDYTCAALFELSSWQVFEEPKVKKKVTMYQAVFYIGSYIIDGPSRDYKHKEVEERPNFHCWHTFEIEVDE